MRQLDAIHSTFSPHLTHTRSERERGGFAFDAVKTLTILETFLLWLLKANLQFCETNTQCNAIHSRNATRDLTRIIRAFNCFHFEDGSR